MSTETTHAELEFEELRQLDVWISENVTRVKPTIEAAAMSADGKGYALWERDGITQRTIKEFCDSNKQYHYAENKIYPSYSTSNGAAMEVLEKCAEKCAISVSKSGDNWVVCSERFKAESKVLSTAIAKFAKQLFSK